MLKLIPVGSVMTEFLGYSQVVRQQVLILSCAGSNPASPIRGLTETASRFVTDSFFVSFFNGTRSNELARRGALGYG